MGLKIISFLLDLIQCSDLHSFDISDSELV